MNTQETHDNLFHVGDQDFEAKVLKSSTPVIVDFWAEWCGPCRSIAPVFARLSDEYKGKMKFAKIDIDKHNVTPTRLGVQAIPTLMIFKDGKMIGRLIGANPGGLKREIDRALAESSTAAQ